MAQKYLAEYYTYKPIVAANQRVIADPQSPLEQQIQAHVLAGNAALVQHKYGQALSSYRAAWGLLPRLVAPWWPEYVAQIDDTLLLKADIVEHLVATSAQILKLRDEVGPHLALSAPIDLPGEFMELAQRFTGRETVARQMYQAGSEYLQAGEQELGEKYLRNALATADNDQDLRADIAAALGAFALRDGRVDEAAQHLERAASIYKEINRPEGVAATQYNLGVARTLAGDVQSAGQLFAEASLHAPASMQWQVTQTLNPGIASFQRPLGQAGLSLLLKGAGGEWNTIAATSQTRGKAVTHMLHDSAAVAIDLRDNGQSLRQNLLATRVGATTLAELNPHLTLLPQFVGYLAHVRGFVLPMALGDTYYALGDYAHAASYYTSVRDYAFLNLAIERPLVWFKLARTYLHWGNRLYRDRDMAGAQSKYENIVQIGAAGFALAGPLYTGTFAALGAETLAFLNAADRVGFAALDYNRRAVLLEALANLRQILNGINYLGFPESMIPIHSWRYLQNQARYFANQAIHMERAYITFKDNAEREAFTRQALEQAVDAAAAAADVEQERVQAAFSQRDVASLSADAAENRVENAVDRRNDYGTLSRELAVLDEITAWATGPMDDAQVNTAYARALGIPPGEYDTYHVTAYASRARSKISRGYELRNMDRQIEETQDALRVANAQVMVANQMIDVAIAQRELAQLRQQQSQDQLANFNAQEFTPELWDNLAEAQRQLSQRYLDWAISAAFLMERAFEFAYDVDVNRIRFDYGRSELHGLLGGDFLLADIDQFSFDRLLDTAKPLPMKVTISLADRFPFQFFQQFQRTGRLEFDTLLEDFDRLHPGAHLQKLRRVEIIVEGLIGREGAQGVLKNSGYSFFRDRSGGRAIRLQKPETMPLSLYDMRRDGFVFTTDEDVLDVFENCGVAGGWTLEFPPESNNLDYRAISNIHMVLYFDAFYDDSVANMARAELEARAVNEGSLGLRLSLQYPDAFFALQDSGEVVFDIDSAYLPLHHADARIGEAQIVVQTTQGVSPSGLVLNVRSAGGLDISQTTDANGMVATDNGAAALNGLRDQPLADRWILRFDEAANAAAFAAGFAWDKVSDIFLFVEYTYTPRGRPSARDDFAVDTLAAFDVADDPAAMNGAPSAWAHDAASGAIVQTSSIFGGDNAINTTPDKPGTYLVHQTSAVWPALRDLAMRCRLSSGDEDAIGLVFRYQDTDNFYFFLMDQRRGVYRLGKKVGGTFAELQTPAVQLAMPAFTLNQRYEIGVAAIGDAFAVSMDGAIILAGRDASIDQPGRVGLYTWDNAGASFADLAIRAL